MMKSIYYPVLFFILSCNNLGRQKSDSDGSQKKITDTVFRKQIPDTSLNSYAKDFDFRYYLRTKRLAQKLKLIDLENGTSSFEMRLWHISSWGNPQTAYILKPNDHLWALEKLQFSINLDTWDKKQSGLDQQLELLNNEQVSHKSIPSLNLIDSFDIKSLWKYPTESEMKILGSYTDAADCVDKYALIIELADKNNYKNFFYRCPDTYIDKDTIFRNVLHLHNIFSKAFSK